ncbi:hypothetical protein XYCOK13_31030 [Xylanibacillus composti]|uniref:Uncharacterized protein n=1 Tax=Xylanibacillus composti TaxID=1572762 RepID=A0A8J4M307_9BACL|nr:hypothetical protein XYCOK13_31030 [Xylanibacillus composti]
MPERLGCSLVRKNQTKFASSVSLMQAEAPQYSGDGSVRFPLMRVYIRFSFQEGKTGYRSSPYVICG